MSCKDDREGNFPLPVHGDDTITLQQLYDFLGKLLEFKVDAEKREVWIGTDRGDGCGTSNPCCEISALNGGRDMVLILKKGISFKE